MKKHPDANDRRYRHVTDLPKRVRQELEEFFVTVSRMADKHVVVEGWDGPKAARRTIDKAAQDYVHRGVA